MDGLTNEKGFRIIIVIQNIININIKITFKLILKFLYLMQNT